MLISLNVIGAIAIMLAIMGGGIRWGRFEIPQFSKAKIVVMGVFGLGAMTLGSYLELIAQHV